MKQLCKVDRIQAKKHQSYIPVHVEHLVHSNFVVQNYERAMSLINSEMLRDLGLSDD